MCITEIALCFLMLARDRKAKYQFLTTLCENKLFRNALSDDLDLNKIRLYIGSFIVYTEKNINILHIQLIDVILFSSFINLNMVPILKSIW